MPRTARSVRIRELAEARGWSRIGEAEWGEVRAAVGGVSTDDVLRSGVPAEAPWRGIRQHAFRELAEDLGLLAGVYAGRAELRGFCRAEVIRARERAKAASGSRFVAPATRERKAAMAEAMLVWLDDPGMFQVWMEQRLRVLEGQTPGV